MRFVELYSRGWAVAWDAARALLPCDAAADDAAQQVFLGLWDQGPDAWREDLPRRYFERAGRNQAQKWLERRSRSVPLPDPGSRLWVAADRRPDQLVVSAERAQLVREALETLPDRCRSVMRLVLDERLTNREIADRLGVGVKAVEKQKARARRLLRKELDGTLGEATSEVSSFQDGGGGPVDRSTVYTGRAAGSGHPSGCTQAHAAPQPNPRRGTWLEIWH